MVFFADLSDRVWGPIDERNKFRNVGWLEPGQEFQTSARVDVGLLDRLWPFTLVAVDASRGIHVCNYCNNISRNYLARDGADVLLGSALTVVFGDDDVVFVSPNLIFHYIEFHKYAPPEAFRRGLFSETTPPQERYFDLLRRHRFNWSSPPKPPKSLLKSNEDTGRSTPNSSKAASLETVWRKDIDSILSVGRWLGDIGVRNWLLSRDEALSAIDRLSELGVGLLGGDLYGGAIAPMTVSREGWQCDPVSGESPDEFAIRSAKESRAYILRYAETLANVGFALVPKLEASGIAGRRGT